MFSSSNLGLFAAGIGCIAGGVAIAECGRRTDDEKILEIGVLLAISGITLEMLAVARGYRKGEFARQTERLTALRENRAWYQIGNQPWQQLQVSESALATIPSHATALKIASRKLTDAQLLELGQRLRQLNTIVIFDSPQIQGDFLLQLDRIQSLTVGRNTPISIDRLATLDRLSHLRLERLQINNANFAALARLKNLRSLDIIKCDHLTEIGPIANFDKLTHLRLERLAIGDEQLRPLANLNTLHSVELLDCKDVTAKSLGYLPESVEQVELRFPNVNFTRVSCDNLPRLKKFVFNGTHYDVKNGTLVRAN